MKKRKVKLTRKTAFWATGIVAVFLLISAVAFKLVTTLRDPNVLGSTTVSVSVTCEEVCTDLDDEVINDATGQPITPDGSGEFNVTDPDVTINTTVKGAAQLIITLTNSAYPAPIGVELFNQIFSSSDLAYGALGDTFEILPGSALASYLQLGRNVFDFYVISSINSPAQDIHRQLVINYTLPGQPGPEIISAVLVNRNDNNLPYKDGSTDYVADVNDLPLHVNLNADNINRVQLTVTDEYGYTGTVYDGVPLAADPSTGYATYKIYEALNGMPGLRVGRNVILLTATGLNGQTLTKEWVVYYWPDGIEPPGTGVIQIGNLTVAVDDLLVSFGIIAVFTIVGIVIIIKKHRDHKHPNKQTKNQKSKNKK